MSERPYYVPAKHEPLDEPIPVNAPPRVDGPHVVRPSKWESVLNRLRTHPGQWFIVCEYSGVGNAPHYLGELAQRRGFEIEMCERAGGPRGNRTSRVYARRVMYGQGA